MCFRPSNALAGGEIACPRCGIMNPATSVACSGCGATAAELAASAAPKAPAVPKPPAAPKAPSAPKPPTA